jgi:hypothetical protein
MISSTSTILAVGAAGKSPVSWFPRSQSEAQRFAGWFGMQGKAKQCGTVARHTSLVLGIFDVMGIGR